ncbi:DKNYY domain-containing protein [Botrimarina mediterranea]|uniref:DKNYY domain-containing protein n=1 Tax=Botrimarina mediterranea TaxID=2528022 RepID=UPI00118B51E6|nr:hypothetical protein K2D_33060 [Planctomycetes bacterium K2D]
MMFAASWSSASNLLPLFALLLVTGCDSGYQKINGKWNYVVINAAVGRQVHPINADVGTFEVLSDPSYAKDSKNVYVNGRPFVEADASTFELRGRDGFAIDKHHAYFLQRIISGADLGSFRLLTFPYARDDEHIYCGSLRIPVESVEDFQVLKKGDVGYASFYYSTDDLVQRIGKEYSQHVVEADPDNFHDTRIIAASESGVATDGVWMYEGPKRNGAKK